MSGMILRALNNPIKTVFMGEQLRLLVKGHSRIESRLKGANSRKRGAGRKGRCYLTFIKYLCNNELLLSYIDSALTVNYD